jgi:biotin transport system substrate-specific component
MKRTLRIKDIAVIGVFAALTAVLAQIAVPLPFTPVPFSMGMVAVYATGILLRPRDAILTQLCYLLLGAVGVPVFGNLRGGIIALLGPTGGYLMVYPIMAGIVAAALNNSASLRAENGKKPFLKAALSLCAAHLILYAGGTLWLSLISGNSFLASLAVGVYPYIPLDAAKIVLCVAAIVPLRSRLMSMNLLSLSNTRVSTQ